METTTTTEATTMTNTTISTPKELVAQVWKGDVTLSKSEAENLLQQADADNCDLSKEGFVIMDNGNGTMTFTRKNIRPCSRPAHRYIMPKFADEVRAIVKRAMDGEGMANICLTGSAGTGKTEFIHTLAKEFGCRVFQIFTTI